MGCHFLLQGIFPTQGSNPGLLHCRQILYHLSYQESPNWITFKGCVSLLIFHLVDLSIGVSGVLNSHTIIVLLLITLFILLSFVLHIAVLLCWVHIYFILIVISSSWIDPLIIM